MKLPYLCPIFFFLLCLVAHSAATQRKKAFLAYVFKNVSKLYASLCPSLRPDLQLTPNDNRFMKKYAKKGVCDMQMWK